MQYNLGCGDKKLEGFVNVDMSPDVDPDVVTDIRVTPWAWARANEAELILMDNLLEHIRPEKIVGIFKECHRISKPNGLIHIIVPISAPDNFLAMYSDSTHVNYNFTMETYDYYDHRHLRWQTYGRISGIPKFERVKQARKGRFLIVELRVIK